MSNPEGRRTCLYDAAQLGAVLDDMAWQAAGLLTGRSRILIAGILRRGAPLAELLKARLERNHRMTNLALTHLQVKRYADDLSLLYPETQLIERAEHATLELAGTTVLVVDDVMYRGHSMLRVVEYLALKQPEEIRTVVLVDRGAAKLPVRTDIVGIRLDVAPPDIVECNVPPYEKELRIDLCQPVARSTSKPEDR